MVDILQKFAAFSEYMNLIHTYFSKNNSKMGKLQKKPQLLCFVLSGNFLHQFQIFMVDNSECCDQLILLPLCLGSSSSKHL